MVRDNCIFKRALSDCKALHFAFVVTNSAFNAWICSFNRNISNLSDDDEDEEEAAEEGVMGCTDDDDNAFEGLTVVNDAEEEAEAAEDDSEIAERGSNGTPSTSDDGIGEAKDGKETMDSLLPEFDIGI